MLAGLGNIRSQPSDHFSVKLGVKSGRPSERGSHEDFKNGLEIVVGLKLSKLGGL